MIAFFRTLAAIRRLEADGMERAKTEALLDEALRMQAHPPYDVAEGVERLEAAGFKRPAAQALAQVLAESCGV
jgi:hypothetical protein